MTSTFLEEANRLPPLLCVLCARQNRAPITLKMISERSGMSLQRVVAIYGMDWWDSVPAGEMDRFREACGITRKNQRQHLRYLRETMKAGRPLAHLDNIRASTVKRMNERVRELMERIVT